LRAVACGADDFDVRDRLQSEADTAQRERLVVS